MWSGAGRFESSRGSNSPNGKRPLPLKLLFIGEAPPASGRQFYQGDSGLYRAMREAFGKVDPSIDEAGFLARFRTSGCYLVDLCAKPVDRLDAKERRERCRQAEARLARTIARLQPWTIATVVRSIEGNVTRAATKAGWRGTCLHLPYPGRWSRFRQVFVAELEPVLRALL